MTELPFGNIEWNVVSIAQLERIKSIFHLGDKVHTSQMVGNDALRDIICAICDYLIFLENGRYEGRIT